MFKLNKKVEYALIAIKHILKLPVGERTTAKEISDMYHCPFDATARMLQIMAKDGILVSEQGVKGGYILAKDLSSVSLFQLMEMVEGPVGITSCTISNNKPVKCCRQSSCNVSTHLNVLNKKLVDFCREISLQELLSENGST